MWSTVSAPGWLQSQQMLDDSRTRKRSALKERVLLPWYLETIEITSGRAMAPVLLHTTPQLTNGTPKM